MTVGLLGVLNASSPNPLQIARIDAHTALAGYDPHRLDQDAVIGILRAEYGSNTQFLTEVDGLR